MRTRESGVRPATFFALTYALSWAIWIPLVLSHFGIGPLHLPAETRSAIGLLGVLMPAISALCLTAGIGGRAGLRALLRRLTIWRVGWKWWMVALLLQPALLVAAGLIHNGIGGDAPVAPLPAITAGAWIANLVFLLLATLGEEIGWRGLALPALQRRHGPLVASIILGLLWATWHIPFWLLLDTFARFGVGYVALNYLLGLPLTVCITWIFNHGRSSLLLPIALHLTFNLVNVAWWPVTSNVRAFALFIVLEWIVALLLVRRLSPSPTHEPSSTFDGR